ncbi:hypothetical protein EWM64_g2755 [Hericium alpestre]|uniref:Uncharacterized protein n=1 Tax=Hericium alpestre TaxID=135208 RepID=A0A4Z0A4T5_9AGAM|nr:hypothetical protein EWM64_g2755 [Hericium alpestre]
MKLILYDATRPRPGFQPRYAQGDLNDWIPRPVASDERDSEFYQHFNHVTGAHKDLSSLANVDAMYAAEAAVIAATTFPSSNSQIDTAAHDVWSSHEDANLFSAAATASNSTVLDDIIAFLNTEAHEDWSPRADNVDAEMFDEDAMVGFTSSGA